MPRTVDLEPLVTRVLAPNPAPMTPGRHQHLRRRCTRAAATPCWSTRGRTTPRTWPRWRRRWRRADARCVAVLVTHHHIDHAEAALPWGRTSAPRSPPAAPPWPGRAAGVLEPGERLDPGRHHDRRRPDPRAHRRPPGLPARVGRRAGRRPRPGPRHVGGDPPGGRRPRLPGVAAAGARPRAQRPLLRARPRAHRGPRRGPRVLPRPPGLPGAPAAGRARGGRRDRRRAGRDRLRRGTPGSCGRRRPSPPGPRWTSCAPRDGSKGARSVRLA